MSAPTTAEVRTELGFRVRSLRIARQVSQEELARRMTTAGIPTGPVTVGRIEAGTRPTPVEELFVIAHALDVDAGTLFPTLGAFGEQLDQAQIVVDAARETLALIDNARVPLQNALRQLVLIAAGVAS